MNQTPKYFLGILAVVILTSTCKHNKTEDLIVPDTTHVVIKPVNLIDSICYTEVVEPIIASGCARNGCHSDSTKSKGINLSSYPKLMATISGKMLLKCITDTNPDTRMPQFPFQPLDTAQISILKAWVNQGMKFGIDCEGPCDTTNVTYSGTIEPIIKNSCLTNCHSVSSPLLVLYDSVKVQVNNGKFLCAVMQSGTCSYMPKYAPKLSNCKLKQIQKWINNGAKKN